MHGAPSRADREAAGRLLLCTLASPGQQEAWSRNAAAAAKGPIPSDQPPGQQAGRRLPRVIMSACCEAAVPVPVRPRAASGAGGRWIHVHVHVRGWARGTSPASSSAGAGPWCSIGPPAGLGRPRGRPVFGLAMGLRWQAPGWPWPAGSKPSRLRRPLFLALVGGLGHAGGRGRWQQRPAGLQPNCGWHWHSAMSVCYIRVLGFLLLTGRVYKHGAYVYEISPECEVERAHTPREENRHEKTRPSLPEHLLVRSCQQNDEGER
jgi:hypothetical protein